MTDLPYPPGTVRRRARPAEPAAVEPEPDPFLLEEPGPFAASTLPPVPLGYFDETPSHLPEERILGRKDVGLPEQLENLTQKALGALNEVLDEPVFRNQEDYVPVTRLKVDAAKAVVTTQVRTDEARFRVRQGDQLAALLELVVKRKAELATPDE